MVAENSRTVRPDQLQFFHQCGEDVCVHHAEDMHDFTEIVPFFRHDIQHPADEAGKVLLCGMGPVRIIPVAVFDQAAAQGQDILLVPAVIIADVVQRIVAAAVLQIRETDLKELHDKAAASGDAMDAQKANDLAAQCDRFEKKLYDLKLTRQVAIQMAPQIRLLQNNDSLLVERIQSTLSNTLPLWKSQMVLALGMHHSQEALKAQTAVTDMTNELLKQNAQALKVGTIQTAKEAERGIVDIETLIQTNQDLIDTINEVMEIQSQGHTKRIEAEKTLYSMEAELKKKLLSTRI